MSTKKTTRIKKASTSEHADVKRSSGFSFSSVLTLVKVGGALLAVFLAITYYKHSQNVILDLTNANADTLKEAFFGEQPNLFFCSKGGKDEKLPAPFVELNGAKGSTVGFAKVNCSQLLPSGKTVFERFKIKKEVRPTVFATAPWMKPQQVAANHFKDATTLTKFIDNTMAPKPTQVFSDKDLRKFCAFGGKNIVTDKREITDTCLVLLRGTKYTKVQTDLEKRLVQQFPKLRIAAVDAKKKRLSFEETGDYLPADHFALKLHALRNGTHYLSMVNPITWDYVNTFVSQTLETPLYGFSGDGNEAVTLNKLKSPEAIEAARAKRAARANAQTKAKSTSSDTTSSTAEVDPAVAEAERVRKERLRREQMEKAAQEHLFDADSEDAEAGAEGAEGEDDDEEEDEVVEL